MRSNVFIRFLPAVLLLAGTALVWSTRTQREVPLAASLKSVLPAFGDYRVTEQKVTDEERKVAGMSDYVARAFWRDTNLAFTTYVGYYDRQTQGKTIHSPRNCLPGAGWEILKTDSVTLATNGARYLVNKYTLKNGPYQAIVLYWYQGRGRVVASEYAVKWNLLRDAAILGHTEEALVRVVAYVDPDSVKSEAQVSRATANAERLALQVGTQLLPDVAKVLPAGDSKAQPTRSVAALPSTRSMR